MKKIVKVSAFTLLAFILLAIAYYSYIADFGLNGILSAEPRKPKIEIPVTYTIGWWSEQKELHIDSLHIDIIESKLNLFNSKSLVAYTVVGHQKYKGNWQPKVEEVHISERINLDTTLHCDRIIEITPILFNKENNNVNGGTVNFEFRNEHTINSNHWGVNRIKFICGKKEQVIELHQVK